MCDLQIAVVRGYEQKRNSSKISGRKGSKEARYAQKWDETSQWKKPTTETTLWCMENETRSANQKEIHFYESQKSTLPWKKIANKVVVWGEVDEEIARPPTHVSGVLPTAIRSKRNVENPIEGSREWEEIKGGNCRGEMRGGRERERERENTREKEGVGEHVAKKLEDMCMAIREARKAA